MTLHTLKLNLIKKIVLISFINFSICNNGLAFAEVSLFQENDLPQFGPFSIAANPFLGMTGSGSPARTIVARCFTVLNNLNIAGLSNFKSLLVTQKGMLIGAFFAGHRIVQLARADSRLNQTSNAVGRASTGWVYFTQGVRLIFQEQIPALYHGTSGRHVRTGGAGAVPSTPAFLHAAALKDGLYGRAGPVGRPHEMTGRPARARRSGSGIQAFRLLPDRTDSEEDPALTKDLNRTSRPPFLQSSNTKEKSFSCRQNPGLISPVAYIS